MDDMDMDDMDDMDGGGRICHAQGGFRAVNQERTWKKT